MIEYIFLIFIFIYTLLTLHLITIVYSNTPTPTQHEPDADEIDRELTLEREKKNPNKEKIKNLERKLEQIILNKTRPATLRDYNKWLKGYFKNGGKADIHRPYPFVDDADEFRVATEDFKKSPTTAHLNIIVPRGVRVEDGYTNCNIFYICNYEHEGRAPTYTDTTE